jgi:hypothetical protein
MKEMSSWITVADWMLDLGLNARELMVFALVYGVCSHNERYFGSREHTAKWARCTADTAGRVLASLTEQGLLVKQEELNHGNIRRCYYTVNGKAVRERVERKEEAAEGGEDFPPESGGGAAGKPVEKAAEEPVTGAKIASDGSENRVRAGDKIASATGAKIADNINSITGIEDRDKGQGSVFPGFSGEGKKAGNKEDATAMFNDARKLWNELGLKPECRDLVIPPSEYDCLRTFQHYSGEEIRNGIRNFDWHMKGRCGKGFKPPPPYGSIYGFLKNGVARYFDDGAIDQQFREPGHGA